MNNALILRLLCLLFAVGLSGASFAEEQPATQVTVRAWVGDSDSYEPKAYAPTQQIILHIEVSTNTWFTAGTKISPIEIADVLVKQRNQLAVNSTERVNGQTWSRQVWEIVLYPQKSGNFAIPSTSLDVQVASQDGKKQKVTLQTKPLSFSVELPNAELDASHPWFTATSATIKQEWTDSGDENQLKVGDSVTRTLSIEAEDSLSVLLPNLMQASQSELWQVYPSPPELQDTQSRGVYMSKRKDSQTYILQQGGDIEWPSYELWWWNPKTQRLEKVTVEGKTLHVRHTVASWLKAYKTSLISAVAIVIAMGILFTVIRRYYRTHANPPWVHFYRALFTGRWAQARALLYKKARSASGQVRLQNVQANQRWREKSQLIQQGVERKRYFVYLWRKLTQRVSLKVTIPKALPSIATNSSVKNSHK